jgi:hypothetical protein
MYHPHYDDYGNAVAILAGGKIIVGASSQDHIQHRFELVRYKIKRRCG